MKVNTKPNKQTPTLTPATTKPRTFSDAVNMLIAIDIIQADRFEIATLKERGKYGHAKLYLTGEGKYGPYKNFYYFTFKPGNRFMTGFIYDSIMDDTREVSYDMARIYGELDPRAFYDFKGWDIFDGVV